MICQDDFQYHYSPLMLAVPPILVAYLIRIFYFIIQVLSRNAD